MQILREHVGQYPRLATYLGLCAAVELEVLGWSISYPLATGGT